MCLTLKGRRLARTIQVVVSCLLAGFTFSCTDLRYGKVDCAALQGEAARMCQEYRQRKADADIRAGAAELLQRYNSCTTTYKDNPEVVKRNCSIFADPLKDFGIKLENIKCN